MLETIMGGIGYLLYGLFYVFFEIIDLIQGIFYTFAGIGGSIIIDGQTVTSNPTDASNVFSSTNGGIVYYILTSNLVRNLFISIATLAFILVVVFTAIAFIKNSYAAKSKPWQDIIASALKGLFNFIFIPVVALIGVWMGNILLIAINGATSTGGAEYMGTKLFLSSAYEANRYRSGNLSTDDAKETLTVLSLRWGVKIKIEDGKDAEYYADILDQIVASAPKGVHPLWRSNIQDYYKLVEVNYLIVIIGGIFILYVLGSISFGMIKRLIVLVFLFVISPAVCAMYPLDDGNAVKSWNGEFKKNVLSAYGAVAGLNLFFALVPMISKISLGLWSGFGDSLIHLIILVCGLYCVKDLMGFINSFFGAGDAYGDGAGLMKNAKKEIGGRVAKATKSTVGAFTKAGSAWAKGGFGAGAKSFIGDISKGMLGGVNKLGETMTGVSLEKDVIEAGKQGLESGKDLGKKAKKVEKSVTDLAGTTKFSATMKKADSSFKQQLFDELQADTQSSDSLKTLGIKGKDMEKGMSVVNAADQILELTNARNSAVRAYNQAQADMSADDESRLDYFYEMLSDSDRALVAEATKTGQKIDMNQLSASAQSKIEAEDLDVFNNQMSNIAQVRAAEEKLQQAIASNQEAIASSEGLARAVSEVMTNINSSKSSTELSVAAGANITKISVASTNLSNRAKEIVSDVRSANRLARKQSSKNKKDSK